MAAVRIVFFGTSELARPSLAALANEAAFQILAVVTQPDRPQGRSLQLGPSTIKREALQLNLPIWQPEKASDPAFINLLAQTKPQLIVVVAYGQILRRALLQVPPWGCLNVHASLLPKYRGAAPIQWALLHDEPVTGVTIMKMDEGLDTGPILAQQETPIEPSDTASTVHDRLAQLGAQLLLKTIPDYLSAKIVPQPQPSSGASYAPKISKEDGRLNWTLPARVLLNRLRALQPWPGAFTFEPAQPKPRRLKIWAADIVDESTGQPGEIIRADRAGVVVRAGHQALRILRLQREGGRRLTAEQFLAGHPLKPGQKFN